MILLNLSENLLEVRVQIVEINSLLEDPRGQIQIGMIGIKHTYTLNQLAPRKTFTYFKYFIFYCVYIDAYHKRAHTDAKEARASDPTELDLWAILSFCMWVLRTKLKISDIAVRP